MSLSGKNILIGVTGGIAAYKIAHLIRLLTKEGAEVKVIMTTSALSFISPLTLSTLSKNPVLLKFFNKSTGEWNNHVELGLWADLFIIAPLSANTLAKLANAQCDNLLTCTYLSAKCPVMVAPAMDLDMYIHPGVKKNLQVLLQYGNIVLEAEYGELASGLTGQGRLMEPDHILEKISAHFNSLSSLAGKKFLITAGPTQEAIDPVRYISNHSSGKMGIAISEEVVKRGGKVFMVLGPTDHQPNGHPNLQTIPVTTAEEMYLAARKVQPEVDFAVFSAAVADYSPAHPAIEKMKKSAADMVIHLKKNVDIAYELGKSKKMGQLHVGFALETENEETNALNKLHNKNFDLIVLNSLKDKGAGFKSDNNKVTFFFKDGKKQETGLLPKRQIAGMLLDNLINWS